MRLAQDGMDKYSDTRSTFAVQQQESQDPCQ